VGAQDVDLASTQDGLERELDEEFEDGGEEAGEGVGGGGEEGVDVQG